MLPRRLSAIGAALLLTVAALPHAHAQGIGIANGFPLTSDVADTLVSPYLPALVSGPAGTHGFLKNDGEGNFRFDDGTPARFFGVTLQLGACYPDSVEAIVTAARLRKLGVNLVRFQNMDNAYDWGDWGQQRTFMDAATNFRTLHRGQISRLDWFIYQLKQRGIYTYLVLQSMRVPRASDGLGADADSALYAGHELNYLYPQARATNKLIARLLLDHVNQYTSIAYKAEPAIAMVEAMDQGSLISYNALNYTEYRSDQGGFSYRHSRRLDTLYSNFLKTKYANSAALAAAWKTNVPNGGFPNLAQEGSFEGDFERYWYIDGYDGVSVSKILTQADSTPDGSLALKLRVRNASGDLSKGGSYMVQGAMLEYNTLYRFSFKGKTSDAGGRRVSVYASQSADAGMYAGLNTSFALENYWKEYEAYFLVPIKSTVPINVNISLGNKEGDILIDNVQIRKFDAPGMVQGESLENSTVARIPRSNSANLIVSSKRAEDQGEFYLTTERNYFDDMHRFVHDTVGAKQPYTGAGHYWASGYAEAAVEASADFTYSAKGWDYISGGATDWQVRNNSPLQYPYAVPAIYDYATGAHRRQPFIASYSQPFPSIYQGEGLLMAPAYSLLQDYDGFMLDVYADDHLTANKYMDSLSFYQLAKNPEITTLMPAISYMFRSGLLDPARTTISVEHSETQARLVRRFESFWGAYAMPGGMPGRAMGSNRVVIDSVNAAYTTQYDDISFTPEVEGQVQSDTRQILWEYGRGTISIDAPRVQATSGALTRAGGITLRNLDVNLLSGNQTATVLWVPLDTAKRISAIGKSLLVINTRAEPTGWHWQDTMHADVWGSGPMRFDPVRVRLTFKPDDTANVIVLTPLDATGMPEGQPIRIVRTNNKLETTIDQSTTEAVWYGVEVLYDAGAASVNESHAGELLTARPSIVTDRSYITYTLTAAAADARIEVFDVLGRSVRLLHAGAAEAGRHDVRLDATDLPSGPYIVRLATGTGVPITTKITVAH
jgi:hypothetical protein